MDDRKIPIAVVLKNPGDNCSYTYDIGDQFRHIITLEAITPVDEVTTREVELLEGAGACPPEDSNGLSEKGCQGYFDFLEEYKQNPKSAASLEAIRTVERTAMNYTSNWLTHRPVPFRPLAFDLEHHRLMLRAMMAGPTIAKPQGALNT